MKATLSIGLATKYFILFAVVEYSICRPSLDDNYDCCALEWKKVIDKGSERFIPSSVISIGKTVLNFDIFYFWYATSLIGLINSTTKGKAYIGIGYVPWEDGNVLTNPHDCVLKWQGNENNFPIETISDSLVSGDTHYNALARREEDSMYGLWINKFFVGMDIDKNGYIYAKPFPKPLEFLYVDCFASFKNQVSLELYDINLAIESLIGNKDGSNETDEEIIAQTEVTNESDEEQFFTVKLDGKVISSLQMNHDINLARSIDTKWGVNATPSKSFELIEYLFDLSQRTIIAEENNSKGKIKNKFATTGEISLQSMKTVYRFNQKVKVKAKNRTKVVIKAKPIRGHNEYIAYYRVRPRASRKMWTSKRIRGTLERMGFENLEAMKETDDGLIFECKGKFFIKTFTETRASILSQPLNSPNAIEIFRKVLLPAV